MKPKSTAMQIAEHFGCDIFDIIDYRYQPGEWSRPVYCGFDGNNYWSAGKTKPRYGHGEQDMVWESVKSNYPGNNNLWKGA
jgi:hypothetical protein